METEMILWIVGAAVGAACLLSMMRRRQLFLIELLMEYIKQYKERAQRLSRAQRLMERSDKIRAGTKNNEM